MLKHKSVLIAFKKKVKNQRRAVIKSKKKFQMEFLQFKVTIRRAAGHCDSLSNYFSMFHPWILSRRNESVVRRKGLIIRMKISLIDTDSRCHCPNWQEQHACLMNTILKNKALKPGVQSLFQTVLVKDHQQLI